MNKVISLLLILTKLITNKCHEEIKLVNLSKWSLSTFNQLRSLQSVKLKKQKRGL